MQRPDATFVADKIVEGTDEEGLERRWSCTRGPANWAMPGRAKERATESERSV